MGRSIFTFKYKVYFLSELDQIVDSCLDLCLKMYCSSKKRNRNMDNEAQLAFEDEINDHKEEMTRIGKEITQLIV